MADIATTLSDNVILTSDNPVMKNLRLSYQRWNKGYKRSISIKYKLSPIAVKQYNPFVRTPKKETLSSSPVKDTKLTKKSRSETPF